MSLSEITQQVLRLVETRSGIPVHVEPDTNLPGTLLAKVEMARGQLALHRVSYRPDSSARPDYLICQQAGFILRMFDTPSSDSDRGAREGTASTSQTRGWRIGDVLFGNPWHFQNMLPVGVIERFTGIQIRSDSPLADVDRHFLYAKSAAFGYRW